MKYLKQSIDCWERGYWFMRLLLLSYAVGLIGIVALAAYARSATGLEQAILAWALVIVVVSAPIKLAYTLIDYRRERRKCLYQAYSLKK